MAGLFKPPAQESAFTLGDEDIADVTPVEVISYGNSAASVASPQSAPQKRIQDAALPVSSAAGATRGPLNGSTGTAPVVRHGVSNVKGADAMRQAHLSEPASGASSSGPDIMSKAAIQSAEDHKKQSEEQHPPSHRGHETGTLSPSHTFDTKEETDSNAQQGSAQPVNGTLSNQAVATEEGQHLDEGEEQRLAQVGYIGAQC